MKAIWRRQRLQLLDPEHGYLQGQRGRFGFH